MANTWDDFTNEIKTFVKKKIEEPATNLLEAIITTAILTAMLFCLNVFYADISFLNEDFPSILWLFNLSLAIGIVLNGSRLFIYSRRYKSLTTIINNIIFFYLAYQVWTIFPFDTSVIGDRTTWDNIVKVIILLTVLATAIGTIAEVVKIISVEE